MGTDQQFCLRWNNFHTNITSAFESLRDDEDFVDITLACEGRQVKAHKMVLSACSPYFRSLLRGNPCQHPIMFLKDVTFANLTSILDFMYHGEVNVSHNELATFLKTAEALKVRGLAEDDKRKESENCTESNSPIPSRDPPDPGSPGRPDDQNTPDTHAHSESPPPKRQRRRSVTSAHSAEDVNDTTPDPNVKDEPKDFVDEDDVIIASAGLDTTPDDIKADLHCLEENGDEKSFGPSDSVTISRSQAMQHLQESFGSFLPNMSQSPSFLSHGASDMPRPPTFSMESVQGLPPGISALPGPSMSQGAASQDSSQDSGAMLKSSCISSPSLSNSTPSTGHMSCSMTTGSPSRLSHQSVNKVQIKEELSSEISQSSSREGFSPEMFSQFDNLKNLNQAMLRSSGEQQLGLSGGLSSFNVSSSVCEPFSPNSNHQVLSPQFRQKTVTGDEVQCNICGRTLCNKYVLKVHMRDMHNPRQNHQCPLCKRCYSSINSLRVHLSTIHKSVGISPQ